MTLITLSFILNLLIVSTSHSLTMMDGTTFSYSESNKAYLLVNIATRCGHTRQLKELEKLHLKYHKQGLKVVGIPSNDFGSQTPEENKEIKKFCQLNYGVTFPLTKKALVAGAEKDIVIKKIIDQSIDQKEIQWNFEKFLITQTGKLIQRFPSSMSPDNPKIVSAIENSIATKK